MEGLRRVVVSGGGRGLGLALVEDLIGAGYGVATCSRRRSEALDRVQERHGEERLFWAACDVADPSACEAFMTAAVGWAGADGLWGLINNAGIAGEGVLATFPTVDSTRIIETNLLGALHLARQGLRHMLCRPGGGRIINISSIIGQRGYTGLAAYSASKAGLDGLTRALAREVGRRAITVNAVAPGYLDTDMSAGLDERRRRQIINRTPINRLGTVADVVPLVRFLLGDGAGFITGQILVVDGGIGC